MEELIIFGVFYIEGADDSVCREWLINKDEKKICGRMCNWISYFFKDRKKRVDTKRDQVGEDNSRYFKVEHGPTTRGRNHSSFIQRSD